jgi:hypothetical protein
MLKFSSLYPEKLGSQIANVNNCSAHRVPGMLYLHQQITDRKRLTIYRMVPICMPNYRIYYVYSMGCGRVHYSETVKLLLHLLTGTVQIKASQFKAWQCPLRPSSYDRGCLGNCPRFFTLNLWSFEVKGVIFTSFMEWHPRTFATEGKLLHGLCRAMIAYGTDVSASNRNYPVPPIIGDDDLLVG